MRAVYILLSATLALSACKSSEEKAKSPLRVGFFPNITHAQALVGHADGTFARHQPGGQIQLRQFNAGPSAMEALLSDSLDASYVGTGPAINGYLKGGKTLRVIAGAANGGAVLVTREKWTPKELKGKHLASPQLGNTQDIALRHWLKAQGLTPGLGSGEGDVTVSPISNADILSLYQRGKIDGAWVPEPWGARMLEAGGVLMLDERDLWPNGEFPTTVLVTTTRVLEQRPKEIEALLAAHVELTRAWQEEGATFIRKVNDSFGKLTAKPLSDSVLQAAFSRITPNLSPNLEGLKTAARHAREVGFITEDEVTGMVDEKLLERVGEKAPLATPAPTPSDTPAARRTPPPR